MDGAADTSDEGSDISDDDLDNDDDEENDKSEEENDKGGAEEEPLNSEDDVTDEDSAELFETDNVVVCQYDKVKNYFHIFPSSRLGSVSAQLEKLIIIVFNWFLDHKIS